MAKVPTGQQVDYFYGDGLDLTAQELGYVDVTFQKGDEISTEEYDREYGSFQDFYRILDIEQDSDGRIVATVFFVRTTQPDSDS